MIDFRTPPPLSPGDKIAVVSPSGGLCEVLPLPYELGLRRLRDLGLEPVEYPTTRIRAADPRARAADVDAAFADPEIKGVMASIGGDDQITVTPHLDAELITANPKRFFGYSDNTNLLDFLWRHGIVGYHGGSVMVECGRPVRMHPLTEESLRAALFGSGPFTLRRPETYGDELSDWADPATFSTEPVMEAAEPWRTDHASGVVEGRTWGGCVEIVDFLMGADRVAPVDDFPPGGVLLLETSEELPSAERVFRILRGMGERGLLERFDALLLGRARAWSFAEPMPAPDRRRYRREQYEAVLRAVDAYRPQMSVIGGVDFGHTDPQQVLPYGGVVRVDGDAGTVTVTY